MHETILSVANAILVALVAGLTAIVLELAYIGGKMATSAQALQELQDFFANLTTAVQDATNEFAALLEAIKNNNGVNPGAIDGLVNRGNVLVQNLKEAVAATQQAVAPPQPVSVSVSPTFATVVQGATQQFSATVSGDSDTSVKWSAMAGSVDASGLYTAPTATGTDVVTATSNADPSKSASASITITG